MMRARKNVHLTFNKTFTTIKTSFLGAKIDSGISEGNQGEEDSAQFDDNLNKNNNMALMIPQSPNASISVSQFNFL